MRTFLVLVPSLLLLPTASTAFTSTAFLRQRAVAVEKSKWARPALIYMPDGNVVADVDNDNNMDTVSEAPTEMLEYLNQPDLRGPLAVLAAANANIEITTIQHVQVKAVTSFSIRMEAICSCDEVNCVNVLVEIDFPPEHDNIIDKLGVLHQQASAVLEQRKMEAAAREERGRLADSRLSPALMDDDKQAEPVLEDFFPSWWVRAEGDFVADCDYVIAILNNGFEQDLKELVLTVESEMSSWTAAVQHASVVAMGQTGFMVQAKSSETTMNVPIKFPYVATDLAALNNAVLDTLEGGNMHFSSDEEAGQSKDEVTDKASLAVRAEKDALTVEHCEEEAILDDTLEGVEHNKEKASVQDTFLELIEDDKEKVIVGDALEDVGQDKEDVVLVDTLEAVDKDDETSTDHSLEVVDQDEEEALEVVRKDKEKSLLDKEETISADTLELVGQENS